MAEHRFQTPEPIEVEIKVPTGDIEVVTVDGDETVVTLDGDERLVEETYVELQGRRLLVELRAKKQFGFGISIAIGGVTFGSTRLQVRVQVPHGSEALLVTASADMKVHGRLRELETRSASGDLIVTAQIDGDATVKTVSGDVFLDRVEGELRVQTVSGDVVATSVRGPVTTKSVSGDLRLESVREGKVNVQSVSGDIAVGVAPGTNLDVDAGSVSGDLGSDVPLGSEPDGFAPDAPTVVLRGKTVSGDVRVFRA
jgi:hypothetical protein